jgi:hypothetical protein
MDRSNYLTDHGSYTVCGEYIGTVQLGNTQFLTRWCVVFDDQVSILGLDWMDFYQVVTQWTTNMFKLTSPGGESITVPMYDAPTLVRCNHDVEIPPRQSVFIEGQIFGTNFSVDQAWVVKPTQLTSGALRTNNKVEWPNHIEGGVPTIKVFISNYENETIYIKQGGLIAELEEFTSGTVIDHYDLEPTLEQPCSDPFQAQDKENSTVDPDLQNTIDPIKAHSGQNETGKEGLTSKTHTPSTKNPLYTNRHPELH